MNNVELYEFFDFDNIADNTIELKDNSPYNELNNISLDSGEYKWYGKINNLDELLDLYSTEIKNDLESFEGVRVSNINIYKLSNIIPALTELKNMIGINDIKDTIFNHVIFYLQDLDDEYKDIHHTVIKGPPGVGKTKLAGILANIYRGLGILTEGKVIKIKREDLISGYLGQTGEKTKKKLQEAIGNVLLFDEAYSLGNSSSDKQDSYAQQAIDQLNWFLSEHGHEFICIIAGYKKELEERFFVMNPGLARRFPIHYEINDYTASEMYDIFNSIIKENKWLFDKDLEKEKIIAFFNENKKYFPHFGGDLNNFYNQIKKVHSKRLLKINDVNILKKSRKIISNDDIKEGFAVFKKINGFTIEEDKTYLNYYS